MLNTLQTSPISQLKHDIKIRRLKVQEITKLSPIFTKFTFHSEDLKDFVTASADDHVKVLFPDPETGHYTIPRLGQTGLEWNEDEPAPIMRDYTPLNYNKTECTLELIFFMRDRGAGALWAKSAQVGDDLYIAGPRGSFVLSYVFNWYLIFTDESGLPSLSRRLQEMPKDAQVTVFAEIGNKNDAFQFQTSSDNVKIHWLEKQKASRNPGSSQAFLETLESFEKPNGHGFVWIKTESLAAMQIKSAVLKKQLTSPEWIKASGYWKK